MSSTIFLKTTRLIAALSIILLLIGCGGGGGGGGSGERSLSVSITSPSRNVSTSEVVTLDFRETASGGTGPYTYRWQYVVYLDSGSNFTSDIEEDGPGLGFSMIFDEAGTYTFTLTVTDSTGALVSEAVRVTVNPPL